MRTQGFGAIIVLVTDIMIFQGGPARGQCPESTDKIALFIITAEQLRYPAAPRPAEKCSVNQEQIGILAQKKSACGKLLEIFFAAFTIRKPGKKFCQVAK